MTTHDPATFHQLYGTKKQRVVYYKKDFLDYALMMVVSALVVTLAYGVGSVMSFVGLALCAFTLATFIARHGIEWNVPLVARKPQDVLYTLVYKFRNLKRPYFVAAGLLLLENALIAATPNLPHHVDWMHTAALFLFYIHFAYITAFRTVILIDHLAKKKLIREVLMQTQWKRSITDKTNMTLEILHAYGTGVLTHIMLLAPWYLVIRLSNFSIILLPAVCALNVIVHLQWLKFANAWFYRDHWLGHNSEFEFLYFHGTHHDAIPSALIAVSDNGLLEGFMRHTMGWPIPFYNPLMAFMVYLFEVKSDMELHQYIPGVFPRLSTASMKMFQHSTHHYGPLEPYGFAFKMDTSGAYKKKAYTWMPVEMKNAVGLDEELTGFKWDNPTFRQTIALYEKYQK